MYHYQPYIYAPFVPPSPPFTDNSPTLPYHYDPRNYSYLTRPSSGQEHELVSYSYHPPPAPPIPPVQLVSYPPNPYYNNPYYNNHYTHQPSSYYYEMPAKRVHFADQHSRTPSPTFSISSSSSSPGPRTPPSLPQQLPPLKQAPSPPAPTWGLLPVQVLPLLQSACFAGSSGQPFVWDLREHPSNLQPNGINGSSSSYPIPPSTLALPATTPAVQHLKIRCELLPWGIDVTPSQSYGNQWVTVGDVMAEIHKALRLQVHQGEMVEAWKHRPSGRAFVDEACLKRISLSRDPATERKWGIRRVDFLQDRVWFAGFDVLLNDGSLMLQVKTRP